MKLKFEDMQPGTIYIDKMGHLCVKLRDDTLSKPARELAAVLAYNHPEGESTTIPLSTLFSERVNFEFIIPNAFDIKRFFPED